jgi:hypothetical protein
LKILHIGDQAGSASITSNICNKLGHVSNVIQDKNIETFMHGEYYENTLYTDNLEQSVKDHLDDYNHIVYHDQYKLAVELDSLHIPSSYMFHGNMLRQQPELYDRVFDLESVDNIFVTTEDLLEYAPDAHLFNRPVDMDMFYNHGKERKEIGLCLTQERYKQYCKDILKGCVTGVMLIDRVKNMVSYEQMPYLLNRFKVYYDIKYQPTHPPTMINELSQTGLQALACGLTVWSNGKVYNKFPEQHSDENSAREFISVLEE